MEVAAMNQAEIAVQPEEPVKKIIPTCIFRRQDYLSEEERNPPPPVGFRERLKKKLLAFIGFD